MDPWFEDLFCNCTFKLIKILCALCICTDLEFRVRTATAIVDTVEWLALRVHVSQTSVEEGPRRTDIMVYDTTYLQYGMMG